MHELDGCTRWLCKARDGRLRVCTSSLEPRFFVQEHGEERGHPGAERVTNHAQLVIFVPVRVHEMLQALQEQGSS